MSVGTTNDACTRAATRRVWPVAIALAGSLLAGAVVFQASGIAAPEKTSVPQRPARATGLTGMATMTGSVTAGKPFKAAQVYIRNTDKRILYMVYTNAGQFRALGLFPGNYEVGVTARGLKSDIQRLAIKAGDAPSLRFSLTDIPTDTESETDVAQNLEGTASNRVLVTLDSYDNVYPPGRGREIAESTCMICHGENFLSSQPARAEVWNTRIDRMVGKELHNRPARSDFPAGGSSRTCGSMRKVTCTEPTEALPGGSSSSIPAPAR